MDPIRTAAVAAALCAVALAGCTSDDGRTTAAICTNFGTIEVELYDDITPITAQNFIDLAESGYYDDVTFHRIIRDFMMQGGRGDSQAETIPDEVDNDLSHDGPGILSMANAGPDTGSSQFFITFESPRYPTHLDGKHTIFGEVTDGMDVVQAIEDEAASQSGTPRAEVYMITVLVGDDAADRCPEPPAPTPADIEADLITPGTWNVTAAQDSIFAWARNHGGTGAELAWGLTGLPDGWQASFDTPTASIGPARSATDHVSSMVRLSVPAGTEGTFDATLTTGHTNTSVTIHVDLVHDRISEEGDQVTVQYRGECVQDGMEFDSGEFPTTLGSGQTIKGFDLGLVGLGLDEPATLVLPHGYAYGSQGGPCGHHPNSDLRFDVTIVAFDD